MRFWICTSSVLGLMVAACGGDSGDRSSGSQSTTMTTTGMGTGGTGDTGMADGSTASQSGTTTAGGTGESGSASQGSASADTGTGGATSGSTSSASSSGTGADSTGSTTALTATGGTTGGPIPCDVAEADLEPVPPNIMLVLDKSGSMVSTLDNDMNGVMDGFWDHDANPNTPVVSRWNSLYDVVDFIVTTFDSQINFGANLFPSTSATQTYNANACLVSNVPEIAVGPGNAAAILGGIPAAGATDLYGGTPATAGITVARDHLVTLNPDNPRAIIFITDGAANCSASAGNEFERFEEYDDQLPVVVGDAWTNDEIPTYVVGIDIENAVSPATDDGNPDNTNTYDALNVVANAGGKPKGGAEDFYQTTNQNELQDALQLIIDDALTCTVPLMPPPAFPDLLQVLIGGMNVPQVMDCQNEDGWMYTNPNGPYDSIELCGTWCDSLKTEGSVTAEYYCNPG